MSVRSRIVWMVVLIGCKATTTTTTTATTTTTTTTTTDEVTQASRTGWADRDKAEKRQIATIRSSPAAAVVKVMRVDDECSSSGGTHLTLEVVSQSKGSPHKIVAAGGHAIWITAAPGDLYIAGIGPPEGTARREAPEWCLKDLPPVDGYATAIVKVADEDEGRARLGEILR